MVSGRRQLVVEGPLDEIEQALHAEPLAAGLTASVTPSV